MGAYAGPEIVNDGLVLHLDAANEQSYPGSGTTWFDLSGFDNHASLQGAPLTTNGVITFDGTDDYAIVSTDGTGSLDFSLEQTIIIWMRHSWSGGRKNPWDQAYGGYGTWTHEQGNDISYYWGSSGRNAQSYTDVDSAPTVRSKWNCMASARDISGVNWYTDGVSTTSKSNPYGEIPLTTNNIRIGSGYAGTWIGEMGAVMAYNRKLTGAEIRQNFNALRGRYGI